MTEHPARGHGNLFTDEALRAIFKIDPSHPDRLVSRESSWLEFKQAFNWNNNAKYSKTMAAFANNKGGYIVFGVGNKPRKLLGLTNERFDDIDPAEISEFLNSVLSPEINWDQHIYELDGKEYGLLYIWESSDKPVMAVRNAGSDVKEAEIYYRYRGRSERIKYPELRRLLEEKRASEEALWLQHITQIAEIGTRDAAILDLHSGKAHARGGTVLIDESLVPQLRAVASGDREDSERAVLHIEGRAIPTDFIRPIREVATPMVISSADIIRAFLRQEKVTAPEQYIKQICLEPSGYLPVYYFAYLARLDIEYLRELVKDTKSRRRAKQKLLQRVYGTDDHSCVPPVGSSVYSEAKRRWLKRIEQHSIALDVSTAELRRFLRAICILEPHEIEAEYLFPVLLKLFEDHYEDRTGYIAQNLRTTLCHLDRVLYRPRVEKGGYGGR
jgi:hypothetical protein